MLCALLRAVKIFFVGNTLFSSHAVVHLDRNLTLAAITYHLEHQALHIDHTVTLVQDARYHACFNDHPHTVTNRYLFLGPELKEKLIRLERSPFLTGGTRVAPCLSVHPYSSVSSEDNPNEEGSQPSLLPKRILPSKRPLEGNEETESFREPSPSRRPPPSRRPIVSEGNQTNTSLSPTPHHVIVNTTIPLWVHTTSGRTIQPIRSHNVSGSENRTHSTYNKSNPSIHHEHDTPTELILEPTHVWTRRHAHPRHRLPNRNVTLSDIDRIFHLTDSEDSEDSEEWEESEEDD